ncbi:type I-E CRISPR-associated protein Cas7/Cse4/CasC [Desulfocurvus sp. DL9XJH121]
MNKYIQLHILTSYPASNLNRDDLGRPKTVVMGNTERLRISSQSLKRAWRTSEIFQQALGDKVGTRTKELGVCVFKALTLGLPLGDVLAGVESPGGLKTLKDMAAKDIARAIAGTFGAIKADFKPKKDQDKTEALKALHEALQIEQLAHLTPVELDGVARLTEACRESGAVPAAEDLELLRADNMAADVALFGRMLAASKRHNVEAAAQVAHAMTVHKVMVDEDFFTAVDDLNRDDSGAGHMGVAEFGAGLFYLYVCIDRELLRETLSDDGLAAKALAGLCRAACTVSPTGKQNSFASRAWASYCLAEKGDMQPRSLSAAFLQGLDGSGDLLGMAIKELEDQRAKFATVYGDDGETQILNAHSGQGSLDELCRFIAE